MIAGQSNAGNHGRDKQSTRTGLVSAFDGRNWQVANDPQPGATGNGGSFAPAFGDAMAEKFGVPVGIVAFAMGGTSVREWLPRGAKFPNPPTIVANVEELPGGEWQSKGTIYDGFVARMKGLGPGEVFARFFGTRVRVMRTRRMRRERWRGIFIRDIWKR